ncbi:MAG TPA: hypothetical protein VHP38_08035, partial [Ruminiclostridium sp.]|nr:hypothetical protein [Ruminiclostridium sp.]
RGEDAAKLSSMEIAPVIRFIAPAIILAALLRVPEFKEGVESKISSVKDSINGLLSWIDSHMPHSPAEEGPLSRLPNFTGYITSPLKSAISSASSTAKSAGSSIVNSIKSGIQSAGAKLSNAWSSVKKLLPHSPAEEGPFSEIPNWDAVFYDPLKNSLLRANRLVKPMMANLKNPLDSTISSLSSSSILNTRSTKANSQSGSAFSSTNVKISTINNNGSSIASAKIKRALGV